MEVTQDMRQKAIDYKKNIAGKFMLVEGAKIKARISGEQFCVTRKIDGHLQCVCEYCEEASSNGGVAYPECGDGIPKHECGIMIDPYSLFI